MRPLGIYHIGMSMYILNMIHFLMILANFNIFSLMVTDGRTSGHTDGQTLLWRCEDLGKKPSESVRRGKSSQSIGSGNVRAGEGGNLLVIPIFWQKVGKKGKELYELQRGRGRSVGG